MSNAFVKIKMCYVYNQWYDISCATLYNFFIHISCYKNLSVYSAEISVMLSGCPWVELHHAASTDICCLRIVKHYGFTNRAFVTQLFDIVSEYA